MEALPNLEELETIEKTIFSLICIAISFVAYLIAIKGMYDVFPNLFKALGAFLIELAISAVLCIAAFQIFKVTNVGPPTELSLVMTLTLFVAMIITVFVRKILLNYATGVSTSILQAVNSLVMHSFYILVISFLIMLMYQQVFNGGIDPSLFGE